MRRYAQVGLLTVGVCLGLAVAVVFLSGLPAAATGGLVDLSIRATAPNQVDVDATYLLNVSYTNEGWVQALDNWVRVTLPEGTQFVGATYADRDPRPPDEIDGRVLTWNLPLLVANSAWGHILVQVATDEGLAEGTALDVLAEIGGSAEDADAENNSVTVTSIVQDMGGAMKRVHVRTVMPADVLEYTITIDLPSDAGRQWVTMLDELPSPALVRFLGWEGTPIGTLLDGYQLRWEGWVEPGDPVELRYRLGVKGDVSPGTALTNRATVEWRGRRVQLGPITSEVEVPDGVLGVGPEQGGQVQHPCGATLTVPPGAVRESTRFEVGPLNTELRPIEAPAGWQYANRAFEINAFRFGEPIQQFNAPLEIEVQFSEEDVAKLKRETLRLWTREGPDGPWAMMDQPVWTAAGTIVHTTTHLSEFALFGEVAPSVLPDLAVRAMAPLLVDVDATYLLNVSYANEGWVQALDNWVRVTLPEGTQFVGAIYADGDPRPPNEIDGRVLTWNLPLLVANSAWGHILVEVQTDEDLPEGTALDVLAEVGGSDGDADTEDNSVTVTSTVQDMGGAMKRVHVREAMPVDVLEYTITVDLPAGETGGRQLVTMTDTLPALQQVRFLGWVGTPSGELIEGHKLYWQGEVQPGQPVQLRYRLGVEGDVSAGAVISNVAALHWQSREMQLGPVPTVIAVPHGVLGLGPGQGGQVAHRYGVALAVPAGAVDDSTRFEIAPLDTEVEPIIPPGGLWYANRAFEVNAFRFGEPVGQFSAPLMITCHYSDTDVVGLKRETLRLWTREGPEGPWAEMGEPVQTAEGTIVHTTTHLSEFALFAEPAVDLQVRAMAPAQVYADATYVVNVSAANKGYLPAPDNWVQVTLPEGTSFVAATYPGGEERPPDQVDGRVLTWHLQPLVADSTWTHILVEVRTDAGLADGTILAVVAEIGGSAVESDTENNTATATSTVMEAIELPYRCYLPLVTGQ